MSGMIGLWLITNGSNRKKKSSQTGIAKFDEDGQNMVLNDLYAQFADSDDVTRKPALVSWVQSLSNLSSQATVSRAPKEDRQHGKSGARSWNKRILVGLNRIFTRI